VGLVTAGMTAFYMWRLMNMTFYGKSRVKPEVAAHIHESPASMTIPLSVLALGGIFAGWGATRKLWGLPGMFHGFESWLAPVFSSAAAEAAEQGAHDASTEWVLMAVSVAIAIIGIVVARYFYHHKPTVPDSIEKALKPLHGLLYNKYYVDQLYDALFVNRMKDLALTLGAFDRGVINGIGVDGSGWLTRITSSVSMVWDSWIVDGLVNLAARIVWVLSYPVRMLQTGRVSRYALFMLLGVLIFLGYYLHVSGYTLMKMTH